MKILKVSSTKDSKYLMRIVKMLSNKNSKILSTDDNK